MHTFQLIADILSFKNSIEDLKFKLNSPSIDWDQFVTTASDHLVLTTCYCRLSQKKLLSHLPNDLEAYLKQITDINRNRNHSLINQINHITTVFNKNNINYTLLKGTALLVGNYFDDIGERMVGDIDILVEKHKIQKAYDILLKEEYKGIGQTLRAKYFEDKHLPRLVPSNFIGAVEIHSKVLSKPYGGLLKTEEILTNKRTVNSTYIPNQKHLLQHSILNFQVNDFGHFYNTMSLRSFYDTAKIIKDQKPSEPSFFKQEYVKSYISIGRLFFNDFHNLGFNTFRSRFFLKRMNNSFLNKTTDFTLKKAMLFKLLCNRFFFFLKNKNYRKDVLKDYKRIFLLLKSKF